ncbi:MAG: MarR family winged helix-turn-helix transcriptional regulator [Kineosporiaceae bacterium]
MPAYEERLLAVLKRADQASQAAKERAVRAVGLTTAQYNVLLVLEHHSGITSSELARRCQVTAQTMSSVLARLVERGLVARSPHPRHPGVVETTVTVEGRLAYAAADVRVRRVEAALAGALDPIEQQQLRDLLARCTAAALTADPDAVHQR